MSIILGRQNKEYKYKFTIIIINDKKESYIGDTIESIVSQNIGFKNNIQIIVVNKSIEKYENIINKNNIVCENAESIKEALCLREGRYISIVNSSDILSDKCLSAVE